MPDAGGWLCSCSAPAIEAEVAETKPVEIPSVTDSDTKTRLHTLIREFANAAVGHGIEVQVELPVLLGPGNHATLLLRLDPRLRGLELWPLNFNSESKALWTSKLSEVTSIVKGDSSPIDSTDEAVSRHSIPAIVLFLRDSGDELKLVFDSQSARDRAFMCLRVFHKSVEMEMRMDAGASVTPGATAGVHGQDASHINAEDGAGTRPRHEQNGDSRNSLPIKTNGVSPASALSGKQNSVSTNTTTHTDSSVSR